MKRIFLLPTILLITANIFSQVVRVSPNQPEVNLICQEFCDLNSAPIQFDYPGQQGGQFYMQFFSGRMCPAINGQSASGGYLDTYPGTSGAGFDLVTHQTVVHNDNNLPEIIEVISLLEVGDIVGPDSEYGNGPVLHYDGFVDLSGQSPQLINGYDDWSWSAGAIGIKLNVYGEIHYGYINLNLIGGNNSTGFIVEVLDIIIEQTADLPILIGELPYCTEDINGDGVVNISDLVMFNSLYDQSCSGCVEDIDGSGMVDINDFLRLNSKFGQSCN